MAGRNAGKNAARRSKAASRCPTRRTSGSRNYNERTAGGRCSFRSPDPSLESENEGIYFRRAQWHSHHRLAEDPEDVPLFELLRESHVRTRQICTIRWDKAP